MLDCPIGVTNGDLVVAMDFCGGLGVSKVGEDLTFLVGDFGSGKGASMFSLLYRGAHDGNASGMDRDGGIEEVGVVDASEVVVRAGNAAGFGAGKVGGVCKDVEDH